MRTIILLIKRISSAPVTGLYAELIAIKPGFHELYLHRNYFENDCITGDWGDVCDEDRIANEEAQ